MAKTSAKLVETQQKVAEELAQRQLRETVQELFATNSILQERLSSLDAMFAREDLGWLKLGGWEANEHDGLSLDDLKRWSGEIREAIAGNPHIKRGSRLRTSYVWDGGIRYDSIPKESRGGGNNVQSRIDEPLNQRYFFGNAARENREVCLYSDGVVFYLGDDNKKTLEPVPLVEITGELRNPDKFDEVWAYRREWLRRGNGLAEPKKMARWYFTDVFKSAHLVDEIRLGGDRVEEVDGTKTIFDGSVNTQIGWTYGVPDALSALIWARLYRDFLVNGKVMSDAMASFAFKASVTTKTGADNASMKLATPGQPGATAVLGATNDLTPLASAGKGYAFDTGRALLAVVATAIEISVISLASDPGTAGSSYGASSTLDKPTALAIQSRRQWHVDFDKRVLKWLGAVDAKVSFAPLVDGADTYRDMQAIVLKWNTGLYEPEEIKAELEALVSKSVVKPPVSGVMLPNNIASWQRADIDPKDGPAGGTPPTAASPAQGKSNKTGGKSGASNDIRNDQISK